MTDVERLLDEATRLPWQVLDTEVIGDLDENGYTTVGDVEDSDDRALIVHAVNRLPDYEAAVEALETLTDLVWRQYPDITDSDEAAFVEALDAAHIALARLRTGG